MFLGNYRVQLEEDSKKEYIFLSPISKPGLDNSRLDWVKHPTI